MTLTYGSVCSGIGTDHLSWAPLGWRCKWFAEHANPDEPKKGRGFAAAVLAQRFPDIPNLGDFTKIGTEHGPIDLLAGGTPCQAFSIAGLRGGLDDERGNLTLEFLRLAGRLRPRWLVWENVPGVFSSLGHAAPDLGETPPTLELGRDGAEMETGDDYRSEELHAFNCFLAGLQELGYGFAWRLLDAQFFGVPQRRGRVFLVGHLGAWQPAAAVLLEPEGLRGDPAPRREAGQDLAGTVATRARGGGGLGTDFDCGGGLIAFNGRQNPVPGGTVGALAYGGNNTAGPIDTATACNAHGGPHGRQDFESETFVVETAPAVTSNPYGDHESREGLLVTDALTGEGFDASEDGTGRGTPIIPIMASGCGNANSAGIGAAGDPAMAGSLKAGGGKAGQSYPAIVQAMAVRRLTPRECERLQGLPDDWTRIAWRGREPEACPDGPRYRSIGNAWAMPVAAWIGERLDFVHRALSEGGGHA